MTFIDLFCGIGGFHCAAQEVSKKTGAGLECVFASDIDTACQKAYEANFGLKPVGDITKVEAENVPDHDLLFAGFPCQPFSIIGGMKGFEDTRGTLFFDIARILAAKKPRAFILENVKMLVGHNKGETLARIMETLASLGYHAEFQVLNALDFGVPQKRERVLIVGFLGEEDFSWPEGGGPMKPLSLVLEPNPHPRFLASQKIRAKRAEHRAKGAEPTIWHENKSGHISAYPYSCALRAGASHNYLLVDGERRLTEREMLRLQGFPDSYKIVCSSAQVRRQAGNSVAVPVIAAVMERVVRSLSYKP